MNVAPCYTLLTLFTLFKLLYTAVAYVCLYILLEKVRTLLEWIDELLSKKWDGVDGVEWSGYPLDCYDY